MIISAALLGANGTWKYNRDPHICIQKLGVQPFGEQLYGRF
jgi:hypothetical protein